jgi:hypothetical protein
VNCPGDARSVAQFKVALLLLELLACLNADLAIAEKPFHEIGDPVMYIRLLALVALSLVLFVGPSWAATCFTDGTSCSNLVTPADTTAIFDFTSGGKGYLVVQFDTVLTTFTLTVTTTGFTDTLDPSEFPAGTVCVPYSTNGGQCVQYNLSGTAGGPGGVPQKNTDYKGLISVTLSYDVLQTLVHTPAFGHAAGDGTVVTVNILTAYSNDCGPACEDPTMHGKIPTPSSLVALDEPLTSNSNTGCPLSLASTNVPSSQKPQIEVTLKEVSGSNCSATGLRDKTAILSVSTEDNNGNVIFPALSNVEGNKFHWDAKDGLNEYDISTDGLVSGQSYTITVFSSQVPPLFTTFTAP